MTLFNINYAEIFNRRMLICVGIGISSGMPLYLIMQLVPAWLRVEGVSLVAIGFFNLVQYPYALKFLWSPLLERYQFPFLGRRRGWMLVTQLLLIASIASLAVFQPALDLWWIAGVSCLIAVFSATQDIVLDAYRREILETDGELAMGNTIFAQAYRISGLIPGGLGLILAGTLGWEINFPIMAGFMLIGVLVTFLVPESKPPPQLPTTLAEAVVKPFQEFFTRRAVGPALAVLAFMFLYKFGDNMATALATPFYIDLGFELEEIGAVAKNAALWPSIIGGFIGALIVIKIGINRALWCFGVIQLATIFGFAWISQLAAPDLYDLALVLIAEYLGVGLGTAAVLAFLARETSRLAVATQFALFTALAALPRVLSTSVSGLLVESIGWTDYFYLSALLAVPGMVLLFWVAPWNSPPDPVAEEPAAPDSSA
ncbi:MAG: AmpG family muropeptide MFS transporter [Pseudomonadota bacterium]